MSRNGLWGYFTGLSALFSQTLNHVFLYPWGGHHDMTVSAHAYTKRDRRRWRALYRLINAVFFLQEDHCRESFLRDLEFAREVKAIAAPELAE